MKFSLKQWFHRCLTLGQAGEETVMQLFGTRLLKNRSQFRIIAFAIMITAAGVGTLALKQCFSNLEGSEFAEVGKITLSPEEIELLRKVSLVHEEAKRVYQATTEFLLANSGGGDSVEQKTTPGEGTREIDIVTIIQTTVNIKILKEFAKNNENVFGKKASVWNPLISLTERQELKTDINKIQAPQGVEDVQTYMASVVEDCHKLETAAGGSFSEYTRRKIMAYRVQDLQLGMTVKQARRIVRDLEEKKPGKFVRDGDDDDWYIELNFTKHRDPGRLYSIYAVRKFGLYGDVDFEILEKSFIDKYGVPDIRTRDERGGSVKGVHMAFGWGNVEENIPRDGIRIIPAYISRMEDGAALEINVWETSDAMTFESELGKIHEAGIKFTLIDITVDELEERADEIAEEEEIKKRMKDLKF